MGAIIGAVVVIFLCLWIGMGVLRGIVGFLDWLTDRPYRIAVMLGGMATVLFLIVVNAG